MKTRYSGIKVNSESLYILLKYFVIDVVHHEFVYGESSPYINIYLKEDYNDGIRTDRIVSSRITKEDYEMIKED